MSKTAKLFAVIFFLSVTALSFQNCSPASKANAVGSDSQDGSNNPSLDGTSSGNPTVTQEEEVVVDPFTGADELYLCIEEIKLKPAAGGKEIKVKNTVELTFFSNGTTEGTVELPQGEFKELKISIKDDCESGASAVIADGAETRTTSDDADLKFQGTFLIDETSQLSVDIQPMIDATVGLTESEEIAEALADADNNASSHDSDDD